VPGFVIDVNVTTVFMIKGAPNYCNDIKDEREKVCNPKNYQEKSG